MDKLTHACPIGRSGQKVHIGVPVMEKICRVQEEKVDFRVFFGHQPHRLLGGNPIKGLPSPMPAKDHGIFWNAKLRS